MSSTRKAPKKKNDGTEVPALSDDEKIEVALEDCNALEHNKSQSKWNLINF